LSNSTIVAVGALGGSGTRAVAQILKQSHVYIGKTLNKSLDNLLFTTLFKNPSWKSKASNDEIQNRLNIFQRSMIGDQLSLGDKKELVKAIISHPHIWRHHNPLWLLKEFMNQKPSQISSYWGWKEPNTQLYIPDIFAHFKNLKYIHVMRNGLDMAFSQNIQQLTFWGEKFNISINDKNDKKEVAIKQLEYWIRANQLALQNGKNLANERFLVLNYEELCFEPKNQIMRMLDFIGVKVNEKELDKLKGIPKLSKFHNRFKKEDISIFSSEQLRMVEKMGFKTK